MSWILKEMMEKASDHFMNCSLCKTSTEDSLGMIEIRICHYTPFVSVEM